MHSLYSNLHTSNYFVMKQSTSLMFYCFTVFLHRASDSKSQGVHRAQSDSDLNMSSAGVTAPINPILTSGRILFIETQIQLHS